MAWAHDRPARNYFYWELHWFDTRLLVDAVRIRWSHRVDKLIDNLDALLTNMTDI